jgi:hypothetical protein
LKLPCTIITDSGTMPFFLFLLFNCVEERVVKDELFIMILRKHQEKKLIINLRYNPKIIIIEHFYRI